MKNKTPGVFSGARRRAIVVALAAGALVTGTFAAHASDYPTRPVRMVVPFGPGTSTDTVARIIASAMSPSLGQSIIVENKAGAGGTIGTEYVARSAPDGYTIIMGTVGTHAINASLYRHLSYDPQRDFSPIGLIGQTPTLLVVSADSPLRNLQDLAAAAAKPPGLSFGSAGNGTSGHLAGELLRSKLQGQMVHVPYKEGGLAVTDVMSGQTQFMFYHPTAVLPHVKSGKLRALGVSGSQRSGAAPDVPTIAEQVGSDFDLVAWFMVYAPAGTPAPILKKLSESLHAALADDEVAAKLRSQGIEQSAVAADAIEAFESEEIEKWAALVKQSGAQIE